MKDQNVIRWQIHLSSPPTRVFEMLSTDEGRARFWAESAIQRGDFIHFRFPNGLTWKGRVLENRPPHHFRLVYFGQNIATFMLIDDGVGGTDLTLTDEGVPEEDRCETTAGWVSVLLALKAAVDFGVDLRNHDPLRTWDQGYTDN